MITFDQFISRLPDPADYQNFLWNGPFISNLTISEIDVDHQIVFFVDGTPITFTAMEANFSAVRVVSKAVMGQFICSHTQNNKRRADS